MVLVELSDEEMTALKELRQRRAAHADNQPALLTANVTGAEMRKIRELMEASDKSQDEIVMIAICDLHSDNPFGV